jgi:molecular chaperone DnaK (HSP70)
MAIIGIDLGSSNSAAAVLRGGRPLGDATHDHL